jgi:1,4-alpha-glucan branching enzyme
MFAKGPKKGTVAFSIKPADKAQVVELAGSFTQWKPLPMKRQRDGSFRVAVPLPAGSYEYKFIIDGQWQVDPDVQLWAVSPCQTLNSVAQV